MAGGTEHVEDQSFETQFVQQNIKLWRLAFRMAKALVGEAFGSRNLEGKCEEAIPMIADRLRCEFGSIANMVRGAAKKEIEACYDSNEEVARAAEKEVKKLEPEIE